MYVPETGHIVGAVNANGVTPQLIPNPPPATGFSVDPTWLVGTALPMRVAVGPGKLAPVSLPAGALKVHTPDDESGVLTDPLMYGVELVGTTPQPALVRLPSWSNRLEFVDAGLRVTVPDVTTEDTLVVAWISDGEDTQKVSGTISKGTSERTLLVTVASGPHGVLVLVAGLAGRLEEVSAP